MYSRPELRGLVPELLQQLPVAGVGEQGTSAGVALQLLVQIGHRKGVHHLLFCAATAKEGRLLHTIMHRHALENSKYI